MQLLPIYFKLSAYTSLRNVCKKFAALNSRVSSGQSAAHCSPSDTVFKGKQCAKNLTNQKDGQTDRNRRFPNRDLLAPFGYEYPIGRNMNETIRVVLAPFVLHCSYPKGPIGTLWVLVPKGYQ